MRWALAQEGLTFVQLASASSLQSVAWPKCASLSTTEMAVHTRAIFFFKDWKCTGYSNFTLWGD